MLFVPIALITCDTVERGSYCLTTKTVSSAVQGCFRCIGNSYDLMDPFRNPSNNIRGRVHFLKYNDENRNVSLAKMRKDVGYSSFEYMNLQIDGIENLPMRMPIDNSHSSKNTAQYLHKCVSKDYLMVCDSFSSQFDQSIVCVHFIFFKI